MLQIIVDQVKVLVQVVGVFFCDVVDLGCGSGLCGLLLWDVIEKLFGVDLLLGMLCKVVDWKVYDFLIEGELVVFLNVDLLIQFDVCVCVDILVYLGDLIFFFVGVYKVLKFGGVLVVSVEVFEDIGLDDGFYWFYFVGCYSYVLFYLW